jgi:hypothetical protein
VLFALLIALSIYAAPAPAWPWRLLAGLAAVAFGWRPIRAIVFQRGPAAVRALEWAADGRWSVRDGSGQWMPADISSQTAAVGPWILLAWKGSQGRLYALIDAAHVSRTGFRALRGRLKLALGRTFMPHRQVSRNDNC